MLKVLIADDSAPIRRWLEYCIGQLDGFVLVGSAISGVQGVELYRQELPDIVITDIEMPGMNGLTMISQIQAIRPAHIIILTSFDNFSYARQALQSGTAEYILKTEVTLEKMRELLSRAAQTIQSNEEGAVRMEHDAQLLIRQLAMGKYPAPLTERELRRHAIALADAPLIAGDMKSAEAATLQELRDRLKSSGELTNLRFVPLGYQHLLFVGNVRLPGTVQESFFQRIAEGLPCVLGLSGEKSGLRELSDALQEAQARCRLHFYAPDRRVFWQDPLGRETVRSAERLRIRFNKELLAQNYLGAIAIKEDALQAIEQQRPTDLLEVKKLCASFSSILLHYIVEQPEQLDAQAEQAERRIQDAASVAELRAALDAVFAPLCEHLPSTEVYSAPVRDAIAYMEAHSAEKISLSTVAQVVNFNPEYFSRIFSRETGTNFSAYLNSLRMRHAVALLEHTDKRVYEIAEETGYSSLSYFSTAFKKSFGQTPAEYQAQHRGK